MSVEWVKLGNVVEVIRGASPRPKGDPRYFGGNIPWIMISDITKEPGKYLSRTRDGVTPEGAKKSRLLKAGALILSNSGTVCVPKILAVDGCIHDGFVAFPNLPPDIDKTYLYHYFNFIRPRIIQENKQGITQVNLNTNIVKDIDFPLRPVEDQQSIVAEIEKQFSRLDESVTALKRIQANLKRYKAAVLKAAVEGKLTERWRKEHPDVEPADQLLKRIKEKRDIWIAQAIKDGQSEPKTIRAKLLKHRFEIPYGVVLPPKWEFSSLLKICQMVVDCHNKTAPYEDSGIPLIRTTNVRNGRLIFDGVKFVSEVTCTFWSKRCPPESGDIFFTREAPMGEVAIIPEGAKLCMGQRMMLLRVLDDLVNAKFLFYALQSPSFQAYINTIAIGTGVKHLRVGDVESLVIPFPPLDEQRNIVEEVESRLSVTEELETTIETILKRAERLRQTILENAYLFGSIDRGNIQ